MSRIQPPFTGTGGGAAGTGSVTNVATGANLTGGPITTVGTISMAGTIQPTMIGTTTLLGGTANSITLGTPVIEHWNGWNNIPEGASYSSGSVLTIPADYSSYFQKSDKISLAQGGTAKYFYLIGYGVASGTTTGTVVGDTGTAISNAAITSINYSKMANPAGFPFWMNWTPVLTGGTPDLSGYSIARYNVIQNSCHILFTADNKSLSGSAGPIDVTLPILNVQVPSYAFTGLYFISAYAPCRTSLSNGDFLIYKGQTSESWAGTETGVYLRVFGEYEI